MRKAFSFILGMAMAFGLAACQVGFTQATAAAGVATSLVETVLPALSATPSATTTATAPAEAATAAAPVAGGDTDGDTVGHTDGGTDGDTVPDMPALEARVGYAIHQPAFLPEGYQWVGATLDERTRSVCLQYRYPHEMYDLILLLAQGPVDEAPQLAIVPGWPEFSVMSVPVSIGGAQNSFHSIGWRRDGWACAAEAQAAPQQFSYALAPQLTWQAGRKQFDLYAANGGCGTPGGLTTLDLVRLAEGLTGTALHTADELDADCLHSIADVEKLAGFDVKEPVALPDKTAFYYATYEAQPSQRVTLRFLHEEHREMGSFFWLSQEPGEQEPAEEFSCAEAGEGCELLQIGDLSVLYHQNAGPDGVIATESLEWYRDGFFFMLFRHAGEPGKIYRDELVALIGSLK